MRHIPAEEGAEHEVHNKQQEQRRKRTPQYAEGGALVFLDEVTPNKLPQKEAAAFPVEGHRKLLRKENAIMRSL